jgi:4-hydroxy-3-methylbut-2-en-1-yl diphosphate synthase IspG/GcpE
MLRRGRKTAKWDRIRAELKKQFAAMNLIVCEMCGRTNFLSFAHRLKRRYITTDEELKTVALLCMSNPDGEGCHTKLEHGDKQVMYDTITEIIERRK